MEIKIQIDRKTGIVLLLAFVAGLIGGVIGSCIVMRHADFRAFHMGFGGGDRMMRIERFGSDGANVIYGTTEPAPASGSIQLSASPAN